MIHSVKVGDVAMINDELKIYRGEDFVVSEYIKIHQPSLGEICDYGEKSYYYMIYSFTATPQSMKWQLWKSGIDYTEITPYQLFYNFLYKLYSKERTSIIFGDLDFTKFQVKQRDDDGSVILCQVIDNVPVIIDEFTYNVIMDYLRQVHIVTKDESIPANNTTKMIFLEDAEEEYNRAKNQEYHSLFKNLISAMVNSEGFKYNHSQIWDIKINAFMDSVRRIPKIQNANLLLQSGYSGFGVDLKKIDKKQLDWQGELD